MQSNTLKTVLVAIAVAAPASAQPPGAGVPQNLQVRPGGVQNPQVMTADQKIEALNAKIAALEARLGEVQTKVNTAANADAQLLTQNVTQNKDIATLRSDLAALRVEFEDHQHFYEIQDGSKVRHAPSTVPMTTCEAARAKHNNDFKYCYAPPAGSYEHGK